MPSFTKTITAAGVSDPIPINLKRFQYGVGIVVTIPQGSTAAYDVEVTGDDPSVGLVNWNKHDTLKTKTASANGNLAYPVTALRLNASAVSGSLVISVVQPEGSA